MCGLLRVWTTLTLSERHPTDSTITVRDERLQVVFLIPVGRWRVSETESLVMLTRLVHMGS